MCSVLRGRALQRFLESISCNSRCLNPFQSRYVSHSYRSKPLSRDAGCIASQRSCRRFSSLRHGCQAASVQSEASLRGAGSEQKVEGLKEAELSHSEANGSVSAAVKPPLTFQEAIGKLQEYWGDQGCALWQPHNTEVGAGTMNPATFLRVIGPEEWRTCYVEPSVRPDDSRYGENPNRLQQHTQMQVILKPDPGNPQELYLGSLKALGIDTKQHDIRFVEDNWENPALGAWGLGWEVWLDGQEITQFTYFQQAGGQSLEIPSVEITYGLERIITALQGVTHFKEIQFNGSSKYGDILLQQEYEMSCFNLEHANTSAYSQLYDLYEKEAGALIDKKLPIPAYQHLLKLSHCFNVLDARGAIGVTQRAKCFATMRRLAKGISELWLERRAEMGHPLGTAQAEALQSPGNPSKPTSDAPADLLFEIGCEELPPSDVQTALSQLKQKFGELLDHLRLEHGTIHILGTPRRLVVHAEKVSSRQTDISEQIRGPPAKVAFDSEGKPSKALAGFCKKNGISEDSVTQRPDNKGVEYVWAEKHVSGKPAVEDAQSAAEQEGGLIPEANKTDLLAEVTDLVEAPTVILGRFDPAFLELPEEVLVMVMRKHQRYFPIYSKDNQLLPCFVSVANGPVDIDLVSKGNKAVLKARFQDALFFYKQDLKKNLVDFKPALAGIIFQQRLGSILEKSDRVEKLVPAIAVLSGKEGCLETAKQAANLAKADLATSMVSEMTALAGLMGKFYAEKQGIPAGVAQAIFETVLPRQAGDSIPSSDAGVVCSLSDRLDSLVGLFSAGLGPTASADIYGLRRTVYGMIETLCASGTRLDLKQAIQAASEQQPIKTTDECKAQIAEFIARRLEQFLVDSGLGVEVARAILNERVLDPVLVQQSAKDLQIEFDKHAEGNLQLVMTILSRPTRLVRGKSVTANVDESLFETEEEQALFKAMLAARQDLGPDTSIKEFLQVAAQLEQPINNFFDNVFVMSDDEKVKQNRLALLREVERLTKGIVDLAKLPGF